MYVHFIFQCLTTRRDKKKKIPAEEERVYACKMFILDSMMKGLVSFRLCHDQCLFILMQQRMTPFIVRNTCLSESPQEYWSIKHKKTQMCISKIRKLCIQWSAYRKCLLVLSGPPKRPELHLWFYFVHHNEMFVMDLWQLCNIASEDSLSSSSGPPSAPWPLMS